MNEAPNLKKKEKETKLTCESNTVESSSRKRVVVSSSCWTLWAFSRPTLWTSSPPSPWRPSMSASSEASTLHVPKITQKVESCASTVGKNIKFVCLLLFFLGGKKGENVGEKLLQEVHLQPNTTSQDNFKTTFTTFQSRGNVADSECCSINLLPLMLNVLHRAIFE